MSEQIIIRLGSQAQSAISWLVYSAHNQEIIASGDINNSDDLPALAERLGNRPVIALVPASDVTLKRVALPAKPNRQLLQALPYMLEDEQAEDIDLLFLAYGQLEQQDGQYFQQVAVCQRQRLESWLAWLQQAGFSVQRLVPDALLLPAATVPACILLQQQWLLRLDQWQATAVDEAWWPEYLALAALPQLTSYSPWPDSIMQPCQQAEPELPLALLAAQLPHTDFNLLQGSYAPKRQQNKLWQQWRSTAALALSCLVCYLLYVGAEVWQQRQQLAALQQQGRDLYLQAFPNESVVNLSRQIQLKVQAQGGGAEQPQFLALLAVLQQQLGTIPDVRLDNLRFGMVNNRAELRFQANAAGFQSFERLKTALEQAGYTVEQGALSNDGARVQGPVTMRSKV
ncbi:type II secretion system protein GspL [Arsukibacterium sp.]|uniref:type II secretion system protein GspL n=1 Tax=Arsukibacterium sp. TaxID=1977258 RepID=UPI002FDB28CA